MQIADGGKSHCFLIHYPALDVNVKIFLALWRATDMPRFSVCCASAIWRCADLPGPTRVLQGPFCRRVATLSQIRGVSEVESAPGNWQKPLPLIWLIRVMEST